MDVLVPSFNLHEEYIYKAEKLMSGINYLCNENNLCVIA